MYRTHYYTMHRVCPCQIGEDAVKKARELFEKASHPADFAAQMEKQRVIGRLISYDEAENTLFIHKQYACESGGGCPGNSTLIGKRCHCDHYNRSTEYLPKHCCKCGAEFYRPMFAPLFGNAVFIEPCKTVLSGDSECVIAVRIGKKEEKPDDA